MRYLNDDKLNTVLENYFNEADNDGETTEKEMTKDGLEPVQEGLGSWLEEKKQKELQKIIDKMDTILKENKYKYYVVKAVNTYRNYVYAYTTFTVYGSNVRPFTKKDKGKLFRAWKKDMEAKKLGSFMSHYTEKIEYVPANIRKYIL